jgi:methionyl aminopeptidase
MIARRNAVELARLQSAATQLFSFFRNVSLKDVRNRPTKGIDRSLARYAERHGMIPSLEGYRSFPARASVSVNSVAIHGIPDDNAIRSGDCFSIDAAASLHGWMTDTAWTYLMPGVSPGVASEYHAAWSAFRTLLSNMVPGMTLAELAECSERAAAIQGLSVIPGFTGHGIGRELHEPPAVPFTGGGGSAARSLRLLPGMVVNIEPVYVVGDTTVRLRDDGWAYETVHGGNAYHFELSVAVKSTEIAILQFGGVSAHALPHGVPFGVLV